MYKRQVWGVVNLMEGYGNDNPGAKSQGIKPVSYTHLDVYKRQALGYARPGKAIIDHCKGVLKRDTLTSGGMQSLSYIPEGDVYRLIVHRCV